MWHPERVTGLACGDDGLGRAAGALGVGPVGIEPEPERDADRSRQRPQQRNRTVDAAAHGNSDPPGGMRRPEHGPDRVGERVDGERLATNRRRLEEGEPNQ